MDHFSLSVALSELRDLVLKFEVAQWRSGMNRFVFWAYASYSRNTARNSPKRSSFGVGVPQTQPIHYSGSIQLCSGLAFNSLRENLDKTGPLRRCFGRNIPIW
jgi:hypothetical protein